MRPGQVTTFYSYKGGAGRTFLMANVAWLLARWGRKVLCLDWDLEAPGLGRFLAPAAPPRRGLLDLLSGLAETKERVDWRTLAAPVEGPWLQEGCLELIGAGRQDDEYLDRLQQLDWAELGRAGLSPLLEQLRSEWIETYDHVLLDSRTGITDVGGICAAQLPDVLVMALTPSHQSLEGTLRVAHRVQQARAALPLDRGGFWCLPVPCRIHSGEESLLEQEWFRRMESMLDWLIRPWKDRDVEVLEYLQQLRVREYPRWSFGEQLPVRSERLDDPALVSWAFANIAALLDHRLEGSGAISRERHRYLRESAGSSGFTPPDSAAAKPIDVFISYSHSDRSAAEALRAALARQGVHAFMDTLLPPGEHLSEALYRARASAQVVVVILSKAFATSPGQQSELGHLLRLVKEQSATVVPVFLERGVSDVPPELAAIFGVFLDEEESWENVARKLVRQLRITPLERTPRPSPRPAIDYWLNKYLFLQQEEAVAVDSEARFRLRRLIEEARAKIEELKVQGSGDR